MAPPKKELDIDLIAKLARIQCTDAEIAFCTGATPAAFQKLKDHHPELQETLDANRADGVQSLRRWMIDTASPEYDDKGKMTKKGDTIMLIWLSKNYLGFKDSSERHNINVNSDVKTIADLAMKAATNQTDKAKKVILALPDTDYDAEKQ